MFMRRTMKRRRVKMVAGPRNHRQLTPGHTLGRGFLFAALAIAQGQDGREIAVELGIEVVSRIFRTL
jgi:hypothetical protein